MLIAKYSIAIIIATTTLAQPFVYASPSNKIPARVAENKKTSSAVLSKNQIKMLISPYKFGDRFFAKWSFDSIQTSDSYNLVFSVKNSRGERIFIWATAKNDKIWHQAQSKNFNLIAAAEDSETLSTKELEVANIVFNLISKNDKGDLGLLKEDSLPAKGLTVAVPVKKPSKNKFGFISFSSLRKLFSFEKSFKPFLLVLFLIIATVFFRRAAKKLEKTADD